MIRALVALLLVPLAWPWFAWPAINSAFRLITDGPISWHWDLTNAVFNWRHLFTLSYSMVVAVFLPLVLLLRLARWNSFWLYPLAGALLGFVGPLLLQLFGSGEALRTTLHQPSVLLYMFRSNEFSHYQLGSAFASAITLSLFWFAAVWANPWFSRGRVPVTEPGAT